MLQSRLEVELTRTLNWCGFLTCKYLEATYGSVKIILKTKFDYFAFSEPKGTSLFLKQRKTSNIFSDKITSAVAIITCCHGKYQNPNDFRTVSERFRRLI